MVTTACSSPRGAPSLLTIQSYTVSVAVLKQMYDLSGYGTGASEVHSSSYELSTHLIMHVMMQ